MTVELRPYQQTSYEEVRMKMRTHRRVLLQGATGSGKTRMGTRFAEAVLVRDNSVMIIGHRIEIVKQFSNSLSQHGIRHGVISPDRYETTWPCQVAMVATLANRLDRVKKPSLLIVDEAHHAVAGTYKKIADHWPDVHTLGLTATPHRLDGRGLDDCFDALVLGPTVRWLIDHGFLAEYRYVGPPKQADLSGLKVKMGDYIAAQVADAMDRNHITGDAESHYRQYFNGAPAIGFCATVAHARHVAEQYRAMGWRAAAVDGTTDPIEREHMLRAIGNGELNFLASCALIDEGTDLPNVQGCQILAPTNSLQRYLQRVGRTLRVKSDGSRAIILDHVGDAFDRHGLPDFKHRWTLEGKKRGSSMRAPGVRQCPKCYLAFKPAPKCPDCGYEFPASAGVSLGPEVRAGELAEVTGDWLKMGPLKDVLRSATTRDQIDAIRKARGYHPNWTNVQISLRAGFRNSDQQRQSGPGWRRHG